MAKKWWNLKNEEEKNMSYSNIPEDHPDVDSIKEFNEKYEGIKYSDKENEFKNRTGLDGPKMDEQRGRAKRFVDLIKGERSRKRTATEGSFKKGGLVKSGKPKLAKKGWK